MMLEIGICEEVSVQNSGHFLDQFGVIHQHTRRKMVKLKWFPCKCSEDSQACSIILIPSAVMSLKQVGRWTFCLWRLPFFHERVVKWRRLQCKFLRTPLFVQILATYFAFCNSLILVNKWSGGTLHKALHWRRFRDSASLLGIKKGSILDPYRSDQYTGYSALRGCVILTGLPVIQCAQLATSLLCVCMCIHIFVNSLFAPNEYLLNIWISTPQRWDMLTTFNSVITTTCI